MADPDPDLPYIDSAGLIVWIAEHADLPEEVVRLVLALEFEYMVAVGIAVPPSPATVYEFRYYLPGEFARERPGWVDTSRIAQDAPRLVGVSVSDAYVVFDTELRYLEMRGLA